MDAFWAAAGMSEVVEENMANAARVHAIERGQDLEGFTMIAFGGGAPLHAGRLAQKLGIRSVLIPSGAGVGSAIGFLRAPIAFEVVGSELTALMRADPAAIERRLQAMQAQAMAVVTPASGDAPLEITRLAELRYVGQGHELRVRLPSGTDGALTHTSLQALAERFEANYEQVYGLRIPGSEVEVVTWSVTVSTLPAPVEPAHLSPLIAKHSPTATRQAWEPAAGERRAFGLHWRFDLELGQAVDGPALIAEHETTVVVPAGWQARLDSHGHLRMEVTP
jgi:N-methylhydantoinase A